MSNLNCRRGKENERYLAKRFGGRRLGTMGKIDVEIPGFAVECKERKSIPALIKSGLNQAMANRINGEKQIPLLHLHEQSAGRKTDMIVMLIDDWAKMYRKYMEAP